MAITVSQDIKRAPDNVSIDGTITIAEPITVDSITISINPGTGATNLGKAEDAPHTSGDVGVMVLAVRNDAGTPLAGDGDYISLTTDLTGALRTNASLSGTVTADQGTPNTTANRWPVQLTDGVDLNTITSAGEVNVLSTAQPGTDIGDVTVNNAAGAAAVNIQDGGNSITVDAVNFDIRDLVFVTDKVDVSASVVALDATTLSALESVTVQNPGGASAVNIQDGGNSITVDGIVTATLTLANLGVTATGVVGAAVTLTLPAAGVGLFHNISRLAITADTAPVVLGANASAVVTSTNLPGGPAWNLAIRRGGGDVNTLDTQRVVPLRSSVANTATTIVAPATANTIWRLNVEYFTSL